MTPTQGPLVGLTVVSGSLDAKLLKTCRFPCLFVQRSIRFLDYFKEPQCEFGVEELDEPVLNGEYLRSRPCVLD